MIVRGVGDGWALKSCLISEEKGKREIRYYFCIKKFLFERVASLNKSIKSIELLPLLNCI